MAKKKLPLPTPNNAFKDGFLNQKVATEMIKFHNKDLKVKLLGTNGARVIESDENIVIDLTPMLGASEKFFIIRNGELRGAAIPVMWL